MVGGDRAGSGPRGCACDILLLQESFFEKRGGVRRGLRVRKRVGRERRGCVQSNMEAFLLSPGLSSSRVGRVTDGFLGGKVPCKVCTGKRVKVQMAFDFSSIASEAVRVHDSIVASTIL